MFKIIMTQEMAERLSEKYTPIEGNSVVVVCDDINSFLDNHGLQFDIETGNIKIGMATVGKISDPLAQDEKWTELMQSIVATARKPGIKLSLSNEFLNQFPDKSRISPK